MFIDFIHIQNKKTNLMLMIQFDFQYFKKDKRLIVNSRLYAKSHSVFNVLYYTHASSEIQLQMIRLQLSSKLQCYYGDNLDVSMIL